MNSLPLSVCRAHRANGSHERISSSAWKTHLCALLSTARTSVHWVRRSVSTRVKACSPPVMPPSWPTRSAPTSPGPCVLPLGEGADRDLVHQTRGRLGRGAPAYAQGTFLGAQQPVDGGRADALELLAGIGVQVELAKLLQKRHLHAQDRHQALAAQAAEQVPDLPQRRNDLLVVEARSAAPAAALADHDLDHLAVAALEHRLAPHPQHPPGVVAGAAVQLDELVEHRRLLSFAGAPVPVGHLLGERLALPHGEPHLLRPPPRWWAGRSCGCFDEAPVSVRVGCFDEAMRALDLIPATCDTFLLSHMAEFIARHLEETMHTKTKPALIVVLAIALSSSVVRRRGRHGRRRGSGAHGDHVESPL